MKGSFRMERELHKGFNKSVPRQDPLWVNWVARMLAHMGTAPDVTADLSQDKTVQASTAQNKSTPGRRA